MKFTKKHTTAEIWELNQAGKDCDNVQTAVQRYCRQGWARTFWTWPVFGKMGVHKTLNRIESEKHWYNVLIWKCDSVGNWSLITVATYVPCPRDFVLQIQSSKFSSLWLTQLVSSVADMSPAAWIYEVPCIPSQRWIAQYSRGDGADSTDRSARHLCAQHLEYLLWPASISKRHSPISNTRGPL